MVVILMAGAPDVEPLTLTIDRLDDIVLLCAGGAVLNMLVLAVAAEQSSDAPAPSMRLGLRH